MIDLTDKDRQILECMSRTWIESDMPHPGDTCYQDAIDFLNKVGLPDSAAAVKQELLHTQQVAVEMKLEEAYTGYRHPDDPAEAVTQWNRQFKVGQEVAIPMVMGASFATRTTTEASLKGYLAVVRVANWDDEVPLYYVAVLADGTLDRIE